MRRWFRRRGEPMPACFNELAEYNTRHSHGVVHTPEYEARMAALQLEFDIWSAQSLRRRPDAGRTGTPCGRCGKLWLLNDPGVAVASDRPVLRCAGETSCLERLRAVSL